MPECEHTFQFQGVVYHEAGYQLPGSSARARIYEDAYFCTKCLLRVCHNAREIGNTYTAPVEGSFPK